MRGAREVACRGSTRITPRPASSSAPSALWSIRRVSFRRLQNRLDARRRRRDARPEAGTRGRRNSRHWTHVRRFRFRAGRSRSARRPDRPYIASPSDGGALSPRRLGHPRQDSEAMPRDPRGCPLSADTTQADDTARLHLSGLLESWSSGPSDALSAALPRRADPRAADLGRGRGGAEAVQPSSHSGIVFCADALLSCMRVLWAVDWIRVRERAGEGAARPWPPPCRQRCASTNDMAPSSTQPKACALFVAASRSRCQSLEQVGVRPGPRPPARVRPGPAREPAQNAPEARTPAAQTPSAQRRAVSHPPAQAQSRAPRAPCTQPGRAQPGRAARAHGAPSSRTPIRPP